MKATPIKAVEIITPFRTGFLKKRLSKAQTGPQ
jgi:hypothetical protein